MSKLILGVPIGPAEQLYCNLIRYDDKTRHFGAFYLPDSGTHTYTIGRYIVNTRSVLIDKYTDIDSIIVRYL